MHWLTHLTSLQSTQSEKLWTYAQYMYDALGQRIRLKELGTYENKTFSLDALLLYRRVRWSKPSPWTSMSIVPPPCHTHASCICLGLAIFRQLMLRRRSLCGCRAAVVMSNFFFYDLTWTCRENTVLCVWYKRVKVSMSHSFLAVVLQATMYLIDEKAKTCQKKPLKTAFHPLAIPRNATLIGQFVLGSSSGPGQGLLVNSWMADLPNKGGQRKGCG